MIFTFNIFELILFILGIMAGTIFLFIGTGCLYWHILGILADRKGYN